MNGLSDFTPMSKEKICKKSDYGWQPLSCYMVFTLHKEIIKGKKLKQNNGLHVKLTDL